MFFKGISGFCSSGFILGSLIPTCDSSEFWSSHGIPIGNLYFTLCLWVSSHVVLFLRYLWIWFPTCYLINWCVSRKYWAIKRNWCYYTQHSSSCNDNVCLFVKQLNLGILWNSWDSHFLTCLELASRKLDSTLHSDPDLALKASLFQNLHDEPPEIIWLRIRIHREPKFVYELYTHLQVFKRTVVGPNLD